MTTLTHYHKYQTTPEAKKSAHYRHIKACFGITKEEYNTLLEAQNNVCAICGCNPKDQLNIKGQPLLKKNLSVDHEHTEADWSRGTKDKSTIRGLLCVNCNQALGGFKDDPALMLKAIEYLNKPKPFSQSSVG